MRAFLSRWLGAPWRHVYTLCWPVEAFKVSILVILRKERLYFTTLSEALHGAGQEAITLALTSLMQEVASSFGVYPEWVFTRGFNLELRASFRYFLLQLDRLNDLICASHYLYQHHLDTSLKSKLSDDFKRVILQHGILLDVLITFFETGQFLNEPMQEDALEGFIKQCEVSDPYQPKLSLFIQQQKDLRECLLGLITTLPVQDVKA